jgi:endonuclease/exonuclease/phosphatase family metal-dependent hydrolase
MPDEQSWLIVGDFNLFRRPENRNRPGGDPSMMMAFNEAISKLGVMELPLAGQQYTWSNMQQNPLIERLDWVFISQAWSLEYPRTMARTLTRDTSDHVPCAIFIKTEVPKPRIFLF